MEPTLPPPRKFGRVAVFCGSASGSSPQYAQAARDMGAELVRRNIKLVYGGGSVGLMGEVATTVAEGLGESSVLGVIPEALIPREISGASVGELRVVKDMHTRKAAMFQEAAAFIALPGGYGTLEELLEMVTWQQLGYHDKPVGVLNVNGFFDPLLAFFGHAVDEGFIRSQYRHLIVSSDSPCELLDKLERYQPPVPVIATPHPELLGLVVEPPAQR